MCWVYVGTVCCYKVFMVVVQLLLLVAWEEFTVVMVWYYNLCGARAPLHTGLFHPRMSQNMYCLFLQNFLFLNIQYNKRWKQSLEIEASAISHRALLDYPRLLNWPKSPHHLGISHFTGYLSKYSKALRCTFFETRKNLCRSKFVQLLLRVRSSKNV